MTHDDRSVPEGWLLASASLSPWQDKMQVMIVDGREIDGRRVTCDFLRLEALTW